MSSPESTSQQREALIGQLSLAGRALSDTSVMFHTALAARLGIGPSDWKALSLLERHGPLTAGELGAHSGLAPASVTGMIDRLERRGWVKRRKDHEDGRRVVVELNLSATAKEMERFFGGLLGRLLEVYARYSDAELELLLGFLQELARCQSEATGEISAADKT
jgi:DNA-binding MarR family transcriptional regulator